MTTEDALTKGERTRLQIEEAAIALFLEQGYHATSMRQIADKANLALGGIYNHFASKDEIFEAVILDKHPYKQILPVILAYEGETIDVFVRNVANALLTELGNRPNFMKLMLIEMVEFNGIHGKMILREIAPKVLPVFERLVKSHKELRNLHPIVLLRSFLGLFFSYYVTGLFMKDSMISKLMPKDSLDQFVDIYLHGVLKES